MVTSHRVWPGRVGSWVSVTKPMSDPVFVVFALTLLLLLGREYVTLESVRLQ